MTHLNITLRIDNRHDNIQYRCRISDVVSCDPACKYVRWKWRIINVVNADSLGNRMGWCVVSCEFDWLMRPPTRIIPQVSINGDSWASDRGEILASLSCNINNKFEKLLYVVWRPLTTFTIIITIIFKCCNAAAQRSSRYFHLHKIRPGPAWSLFLPRRSLRATTHSTLFTLCIFVITFL